MPRKKKVRKIDRKETQNSLDLSGSLAVAKKAAEVESSANYVNNLNYVNIYRYSLVDSTKRSIQPNLQPTLDNHAKSKPNAIAKEIEKMMNDPETKKALEDASDSMGIPLGYLMVEAILESSGNKNPHIRGDHVGLMQVGEAVVKDDQKTHPEINYEGVKNKVEMNVLAAAIFEKKSTEALQNHNIPINLLNLYLSHQQGATGFNNLMTTLKTNPNAPITDKQRSNFPDEYKQGHHGNLTQQEFYDDWKDKIDSVQRNVDAYFKKENLTQEISLDSSQKLSERPNTSILPLTSATQKNRDVPNFFNDLTRSFFLPVLPPLLNSLVHRPRYETVRSKPESQFDDRRIIINKNFKSINNSVKYPGELEKQTKRPSIKTPVPSNKKKTIQKVKKSKHQKTNVQEKAMFINTINTNNKVGMNDGEMQYQVEKCLLRIFNS